MALMASSTQSLPSSKLRRHLAGLLLGGSGKNPLPGSFKVLAESNSGGCRTEVPLSQLPIRQGSSQRPSLVHGALLLSSKSATVPGDLRQCTLVGSPEPRPSCLSGSCISLTPAGESSSFACLGHLPNLR